MKFRICLFTSIPLCVLSLHAQTAPTLAVDANANRHLISPYIYGINEYADTGLASIMHIPLRRFGGDATTSYNWQIDVSNSVRLIESFGLLRTREAPNWWRVSEDVKT
jgi:hypothetical protein